MCKKRLTQWVILNNLFIQLIYWSFTSRKRRTADLTEAAVVVENTQAPPATVLLHRLQDQIPTTLRFMASYKLEAQKFLLLKLYFLNIHSIFYTNFATWLFTFPQKVQVYLLCCVISIFLTIFLREAPYRVPYLPVIPTFLVRLACWINIRKLINAKNQLTTLIDRSYYIKQKIK